MLLHKLFAKLLDINIISKGSPLATAYMCVAELQGCRPLLLNYQTTTAFVSYFSTLTV